MFLLLRAFLRLSGALLEAHVVLDLVHHFFFVLTDCNVFKRVLSLLPILSVEFSSGIVDGGVCEGQ